MPTLDAQAERIRNLELSHRMLTDQLAAMVDGMRDMRTTTDSRLGALEAELAANSETTAEVRDILQVAKAGLKVLGGIGTAVRWMGYLSTAVLAVWGAIVAFKSGVPK